MNRRGFLAAETATAAGLVLPYEPRRVYSFPTPRLVPPRLIAILNGGYVRPETMVAIRRFMEEARLHVLLEHVTIVPIEQGQRITLEHAGPHDVTPERRVISRVD